VLLRQRVWARFRDGCHCALGHQNLSPRQNHQSEYFGVAADDVADAADDVVADGAAADVVAAAADAGADAVDGGFAVR